MAGFGGTVHGSGWASIDQKLAYVLPAKLLAMTIVDSLAYGARGARYSGWRHTGTNEGRIPGLHASQHAA